MEIIAPDQLHYRGAVDDCIGIRVLGLRFTHLALEERFGQQYANITLSSKSQFNRPILNDSIFVSINDCRSSDLAYRSREYKQDSHPQYLNISITTASSSPSL